MFLADMYLVSLVDESEASPCRDCGGIDGIHADRCLDIRDHRETREDKAKAFYEGDNR